MKAKAKPKQIKPAIMHQITAAALRGWAATTSALALTIEIDGWGPVDCVGRVCTAIFA